MSRARKIVIFGVVIVLLAGVGAVVYKKTRDDRIAAELGPEEPIDPTPNVSFTSAKVADLQGPSSIALGPDGALYSTSTTGQIMRYPLGPDGFVNGEPRAIETYTNKRLLMGIAFDPKSTPDDPILWVSGGQLCLEKCDDFTGVVSVLTGKDLSNARDVIVGLPRSVGDHMTNGVAFGPGGRLYIAQGSTTGYGAPDETWGFRDETLLSATILEADVHNDSRFNATVDVDTSKGYNPGTIDAPVKVFATGTRNPFDLVWHSNGSLYAPINESSDGDAPAGPDNNPPGVKGIPSGNDFLARIVEGRYYGHPNPSRRQFVVNGGNPTKNKDPFETKEYPVGVQPDPNYDLPIVDLGVHRSANGIAEYTADKFNGELKGKLLITEFEKGDDILVIDLRADGSFDEKTQLIKGLRNPLDVIADPATGRIYVAEFGSRPLGSRGKITMLTPAS